ISIPLRLQCVGRFTLVDDFGLAPPRRRLGRHARGLGLFRNHCGLLLLEHLQLPLHDSAERRRLYYLRRARTGLSSTDLASAHACSRNPASAPIASRAADAVVIRCTNRAAFTGRIPHTNRAVSSSAFGPRSP